ncbi:hypothetical protein MANES_02G144450v8 [Manihot esculenta]|uniref:Uncharacterized protein n=1 Tax=Manihot esculenta TaxID=3983 RepID=A0ACB7IB50_MANES|nr:hypothetical protein MANES_02G144450v8 [Manihot esculenta]
MSIVEESSRTKIEAKTEDREYSIDDPLFLHSSDHPGLVLVSSPLTGDNYLSWSRSMLIALRAKDKLGFIDGKCRVDSAVASWILNAISKQIVEAFIYTKYYGESNRPLLFQIKRDICSLTQDNLAANVYFIRLKKMWDELTCLRSFPSCTCGACACGAAKAVAAVENEDRLIQFFMGLNENYEHVKSQILIMDPLPSVNKRSLQNVTVESSEQTNAMLARTQGYRKDNTLMGGFKNTPNRREYGKRDDRLCTYCNIYPYWYKDLKKKGKQPVNAATHVSDTPLVDVGQNGHGDWNNKVDISALAEEIMKFIKGKNVMDEQISTNIADFAGEMSQSSHINMYYKNYGYWIVDTGATNHMCSDLQLFDKTNLLLPPKVVHLPDGSL